MLKDREESGYTGFGQVFAGLLPPHYLSAEIPFRNTYFLKVFPVKELSLIFRNVFHRFLRLSSFKVIVLTQKICFKIAFRRAIFY